MDLELFTVKDYDKGLRPTRLRGGARLTSFHYFPGADFCFAGVDNAGITHLWRNNGRKNGKVNNMHTDLVKEIVNPDFSVFYLAVLPSGGYYAGHDIEKLKQGITLASKFDLYRFEINFKKQELIEWEFMETVAVKK
jgi:hypothetical protein